MNVSCPLEHADAGYDATISTVCAGIPRVVCEVGTTVDLQPDDARAEVSDVVREMWTRARHEHE